MKTKFFLTIVSIVSVVALSGCGISKKSQFDYLSTIHVHPTRSSQLSFPNLTSGLQVSVLSTMPSAEGTKNVHHLSGTNLFSMPTANYVRSMGFREMSSGSDYQLFITILRADLNGKNGESYVEMSLSLKDPFGEDVYNQTNITGSNKTQQSIRGRLIELANRSNGILTASKSDSDILGGLNEAYTLALEQIDWYRIASFLTVAQRPAEEPHKKVTGKGDTALEQTVIRWDVQSRPQGADLFWRVVSKTPEVKSTNNKYLNTTPYEATKTLDIKGLDYQTSGNVRIILRCEKEGYLPQEKEFDVRMIMDQEEIAAFFRLVVSVSAMTH